MLPMRFVTRNICLGSSVLRTRTTNIGKFNRLIRRESSVELPRNYATYEGDGKTVGFVINKKTSKGLFIAHVSTEGFTMASGAEIVGAMILFPHSIISWHVTTVQDVTEDSLTLFKILEPKLDVLVFGYGNKNAFTPEIRQRFTQICKKIGVRFEALPTVQAVGVYNFLAEERRFVAAALIPPAETDRLVWDRSKDVLLEDDSEELEALPGDTPDKK